MVRPLQVTVTAPAGTLAPTLVKVTFIPVTLIPLVVTAVVHDIVDDNKPHTALDALLNGPDVAKLNVITSSLAIAVDVVNVTVADAVPDATAVVMLRAVAAAETQPTHGVER